MKLTKTTPPPTPTDWTETFEEIVKSPGQWFKVDGHDMAPSSVRPWAHKVSSGRYVTANKVALLNNGHFEAVVHDNTLNIRFVSDES